MNEQKNYDVPGFEIDEEVSNNNNKVTSRGAGKFQSTSDEDLIFR